MSRRSVTRAVCAPLAIALATTAIPTAIQNSSAINHWTAKTWSATLVYAEAGANRLGQEFGQYAEAGAEKIAQKRDELGAQLSAKIDQTRDELGAQFSAAADTVASGTGAALARIDSFMTSVSQTVIAMLPSKSDEPAPATAGPVDMALPAVEDVQQTASLPAVDTLPSVSLPVTAEIEPVVTATPVETAPAPTITAATEPPAPQVNQEPVEQALPEIKKTMVPAPVEKAVVAALELAQPILSTSAAAAVAPDVKIEPPIEAGPVTTEPVAKVKPAFEMPVETEAAPVLEAKVVVAEKPSVAAETKIAVEPIPAIESKAQEAKADEKLVVASLSRHLGPADTDAIAAPMRAIELKTQESQTNKADEKPVVASLGPQQSAVDAPASEYKALPSSSEPAASNNHIIDPLQMTNVPMSSPLKIRALTRADIPSAEKLASLGSSKAAGSLPAEEQRVAYDAPIPLDEPTSIGRRKWTEEAAKYQGLGSPEALLEALKHMGAGAKTLGLPASLWCADFMNLVLRKSGVPATGSRAAKSYLQYGKKIDEPRVGAIAIFSRGKNGGHIGIVRGTDGKGNPIIVSGNHNNKVAEAIYPKERVLAYVVPR